MFVDTKQLVLASENIADITEHTDSKVRNSEPIADNMVHSTEHIANTVHSSENTNTILRGEKHNIVDSSEEEDEE